MLHIFLLLPLSFLFDFKLSNETFMLIVLVLVHIFTNLLRTSHFCFSAHVSRLYIILVRFFSRHFICKRFTFLLYKTLCGLHVHCIIFILDLRTSKYLTFEIFQWHEMWTLIQTRGHADQYVSFGHANKNITEGHAGLKILVRGTQA